MTRLFEPTTGVSSAQGLDVSNFQGQFNWASAVESTPGLAFGICRVTQGLGTAGEDSPDFEAAWNLEQMATQQLIRGAYHFLDPKVSGAAQAQYFYNTMKRFGVVATDMLWLDHETAGSTPAITAACAFQFMEELKRLAPDNPMGVYTFIDFAKNGNCAGLGAYPLWLAYPASTSPVQPPPWQSSQFKFWQWGIRNGDDADAYMGTAAELGAWIDSFKPKPVPVEIPAPKSMSETVYPLYVDFGWSSVGTGLRYHLQVLADHGMKVVSDVITTNLSYRVTGLTANTSYVWRVSADPGGEWSVERPFVTDKAAKASFFDKLIGRD